MFIVYDQSFNKNEWFILTSLTIGFLLVYILPKRFSLKESLVYLLYFVFLGLVVDHTISIEPFDFYDVNDTSAFELMDFLSYLTYGPFGYLFIYVYDFLKIKNSYNPIYVLPWAIVAVLVEYVAQALGVFHYKNGYKVYYSFPIYLLLLMSHLFLYRLIKKNHVNSSSN